MDSKVRNQIAKTFGSAVDDLVVELYSETQGGSTVQEPEITSRLCQRLEDRLDGTQVGDYRMSITAQSLPDRGHRSLEKITGADLYVAISVEGEGGFDKGLFVQAKYDRNGNVEELRDACSRMTKIASGQGSYVWVYTPTGVKVVSAEQVLRSNGRLPLQGHTRTMSGHARRILDCNAGTRSWGVQPLPRAERRSIIAGQLRNLRTPQALDIVIEHDG
ncbi:hypothetical protein NHN26_17190 [Rhodovulum tesquicola]|uniref:hypothetical protein n=1 Tax=Rhodovulum tesquicola TaxID=540254 RepID=UPI0020980A62|nr:hypothetical protein [Rhodovulum tesquicola]MCO8146924.1 hypothetical protein [Rhodovulum tesquicola]